MFLFGILRTNDWTQYEVSGMIYNASIKQNVPHLNWSSGHVRSDASNLQDEAKRRARKDYWN